MPSGVTANGTHYVPGRDGQRFLVNTATDAVVLPMTVVLNWTATLKKWRKTGEVCGSRF